MGGDVPTTTTATTTALASAPIERLDRLDYFAWLKQCSGRNNINERISRNMALEFLPNDARLHDVLLYRRDEMSMSKGPPTCVWMNKMYNECFESFAISDIEAPTAKIIYHTVIARTSVCGVETFRIGYGFFLIRGINAADDKFEELCCIPSAEYEFRSLDDLTYHPSAAAFSTNDWHKYVSTLPDDILEEWFCARGRNNNNNNIIEDEEDDDDDDDDGPRFSYFDYFQTLEENRASGFWDEHWDRRRRRQRS